MFSKQFPTDVHASSHKYIQWVALKKKSKLEKGKGVLDIEEGK